MGSAELYDRASRLETLAQDVETCVDTVRQVAATPQWACTNADDVRGAIDVWRTRAGTAAANLRGEASRVRAEARRAEEREAEERERERRERDGTAPRW